MAVLDAAIRHVAFPNGYVGAAHRQVQAGVYLAQLLLELFVGRDVGAGPEPFADLARAVPDCHAPALEPAIRAVEAAQAVFDLVFALTRDGGSPGLLDAFPVIGVLYLQPAPTQHFALRAAQVLPDLRAGVVHAAVGHVGPDELRQRLRQAPPALLALAQRLLGLFAGG